MTYLSVIIPAYNEEKIIKKHLIEVSSYLKKQFPRKKMEVLVINDGSTDNTKNILVSTKKIISNLKIINHFENQGRGAAIINGLKRSSGEYIVCLDADLSYNVNHIKKLLSPLINKNADITLASAHHPLGSIANVPLVRLIISKIGNFLIGLSLSKKIYTSTCSVRAFKRKSLKKLVLQSKDKDLHLEIIRKSILAGLKIVEVPATLKWRDINRRSKSKNLLQDLISLFGLRKSIFSHLIFNYSSKPGLFLIFPIIILFALSVASFYYIVKSIFINYTILEQSFYLSVRTTLINGNLTFLVLVFASISLLIFIIFYFLSSQNKRIFEENYLALLQIREDLENIKKSQKK